MLTSTVNAKVIKRSSSTRWFNHWKDLLPSDIQQYFNFVLWLTEGVYRKITFFALSSKNWNEIVNPIYNVFILYLNLSVKKGITINFHS